MAIERDLKHAQNLAAKIRAEDSNDVSDPITQCMECGQDTFKLAGTSDDGVVDFGKCLHCGFELDEEGALDAALVARIAREP